MSDDSKAPTDLSTLGIDLSDMFRPAWTVESSDSTARLAAKYDEGDRGERSDRRGGGRNEGQGQHRGPRPSSGSRDRDSRGPRSHSGGRDAKAGPVGERSSRDRGAAHNSRDPRDRRQEDRRPEESPKPVLEGWKLSLIPEHSALEAIAKQIRSRAKAYPLFELARLIVNLSDRYSVTLKADSEESPKLFRVKTDGSLWTSRKQAISHLLSKHLEKFYRKHTVTVEAPKGNYSVVAQCGMSGVLLGPPNHHEYQSRLLALHASRFKNLSFEVYKTRIKMMRDDALMEQWKTERSTSTVFVPIDPAAESAPVVNEPLVVPEANEVVSASPAEEVPTPVECADETLVSETSPVIQETEESASSSEESAAEPEISSEAPESAGPQLNLEEVAEHFQNNHAETEVEAVGPEITVSGRIALHESDPLLHDLLIKTLQELDRFPLPLAQQIGKELSGSGLQIYKAHKKIITVSVARPRYLDRATTPTSEGFRGILDYLEAHPKQPRDKQWAGMLALRKEPAGDDAEAVKQREQALGTDLLWLLHQGHVIDFAMGNLQAATPPVQQQKPAPPVVEKVEKKEASKATLENEVEFEGTSLIVEEISSESSEEESLAEKVIEPAKTADETIVESAIEEEEPIVVAKVEAEQPSEPSSAISATDTK